MEPQTAVNILNTSIIVLVTTIIYALVWLYLSVKRVLRRWNKNELEFYNETMLKLKLKDWNGRKNS